MKPRDQWRNVWDGAGLGDVRAENRKRWSTVYCLVPKYFFYKASLVCKYVSVILNKVLDDS